MMRQKKRKQAPDWRSNKLYSVLLPLFFLLSCGPKIYFFENENKDTAVTTRDSIKLHWKVKGTPTMLVQESKASRGGDSIKIIAFTLVAEKGKTAVRRLLQIELLEGEQTDMLSFNTVLEGDSVLVAAGTKSISRWQDFKVLQIASASGRPLKVVHENRTVSLPADGTGSAAFSGLTYAGNWQLRTPLTADEKLDHSKLPNVLSLKALIQKK